LTARPSAKSRRLGIAFEELLPQLQEVSELLWRQSGGFCDTAHSDCINGIMPGNDEARLAIRHDNMAALACHAKTELFKNAYCVLLADSRNLGRGALNRNEFRGHFLVVLRGLAPYVFFRDFQPQLDGFPDVAQGFFTGLALTPATGQRGAADRKAFIRFYQ
jgi:hypothetical protein